MNARKETMQVCQRNDRKGATKISKHKHSLTLTYISIVMHKFRKHEKQAYAH